MTFSNRVGASQRGAEDGSLGELALVRAECTDDAGLPPEVRRNQQQRERYEGE